MPIPRVCLFDVLPVTYRCDDVSRYVLVSFFPRRPTDTGSHYLSFLNTLKSASARGQENVVVPKNLAVDIRADNAILVVRIELIASWNFYVDRFLGKARPFASSCQGNGFEKPAAYKVAV